MSSDSESESEDHHLGGIGSDAHTVKFLTAECAPTASVDFVHGAANASLAPKVGGTAASSSWFDTKRGGSIANYYTAPQHPASTIQRRTAAGVVAVTTNARAPDDESGNAFTDSIINTTPDNLFECDRTFIYTQHKFVNALSIITVVMFVYVLIQAVMVTIAIEGDSSFNLSNYRLAVTITTVSLMFLTGCITLWHVSTHSESYVMHNVAISMPTIVFAISQIFAVSSLQWYLKETDDQIHRHNPALYVPIAVILLMFYLSAIVLTPTCMNALAAHWLPRRAPPHTTVVVGLTSEQLASRRQVSSALSDS